MPLGLKPGGRAFGAIWFQSVLMWQGEAVKQGQCCSALVLWLCSISAISHLGGVKPISTAFCAVWLYADIDQAFKTLSGLSFTKTFLYL
jgi:hypothetical protein